MIDYRAVYADLRYLKKRALHRAFIADREGRPREARAVEAFIAEIEAFMDDIAMRKW